MPRFQRLSAITTVKGVLIVEVPTDEVLSKFVVKIGSAGNVRTSTVRAYAEDEYRRIIGGVS